MKKSYKELSTDDQEVIANLCQKAGCIDILLQIRCSKTANELSGLLRILSSELTRMFGTGDLTDPIFCNRFPSLAERNKFWAKEIPEPIYVARMCEGDMDEHKLTITKSPNQSWEEVLLSVLTNITKHKYDTIS